MAEEIREVLYSGNLGIDYGQFYIDVTEEDEDDYLDPDGAFDGQENGICGTAQKGKIFFVTGIQSGVIKIDIELHQSEPSRDESYEEIVEASFERGKDPISLCEWAHEETHGLNIEQGVYRIRYCIEGMEKEYADDADWDSPVPGQCHLIQIWASESEKDKVIKQTSSSAEYWHKEWGSWE